MQYAATFLIASLSLASAQAVAPPDVVQPPAISPAEANEHALLQLAENFKGEETLRSMQKILRQGVNVNATDSEGNTPLLLLCRALEMDYRYRNNPHYAQAVDKAMILLLSNGANAMQENRSGCNAVFFLQSKPELQNTLKSKKLLPKELAVRIPYEPLALRRYMRLRVEQASLTTHRACREYLSRHYCAPAYARVKERLDSYLAQESGRNIPPGALKDCLAFLFLANEREARAFVNGLIYWEHGEHFIEEIPALMLSALNELHWPVKADRLRSAIRQLHCLLPKEGEEMISCSAAKPMGELLELLLHVEGESALGMVREYSRNRDPELAYLAYKILLRQRKLPIPEPQELEPYFDSAPEGGVSDEQRLFYTTAKVDTAMRSGNIAGLTDADFRQAQQYYTDNGLERHAQAVEMLFSDGELSQDPYTIQAAHHRYMELLSPAPSAIMARYLLEHPEILKHTGSAPKK